MATTEKKIAIASSVKTVAPVAPKVTTMPAAPVTTEKVVASKVTAKPVAKRSASITKAAAKPAVKSLAKPKAEKPAKVKKPKLVRDSFTIPKAEYTVLDDLKQRAGKLESAVKKSELLRAGVKALAAMSDATFLAALKAVPAIKTGRPTKD
jgi:hypothetical protein